MFSLSKESEQDLTHGLLELVGNYLEARDKVKPRALGVITAQQVKEELGIKSKTLKRSGSTRSFSGICRASASSPMLSMDTLRSPRSTSLTYVRDSPASSARAS